MPDYSDISPKPGDLSGYIHRVSGQWMYSVWCPHRGWVDVGYDSERARERADEFAARAALGEGQTQ